MRDTTMMHPASRRFWRGRAVCRARGLSPRGVRRVSSFDYPDIIRYAYNIRGELTNAVADVDADYRYSYAYDDIGNRLWSLENTNYAVYAANELNQYTLISNFCVGISQSETFEPQYDDDGNQTLIKTETGIWNVQYNGENRPIYWSNGATNIVMAFDRMGRRVKYVEMNGAVTNSNKAFTYDKYVCVANSDTRINDVSNSMTYIWNPIEPVATRPLTFANFHVPLLLYYIYDGRKNVSCTVNDKNITMQAYKYAPYGGFYNWNVGGQDYPDAQIYGFSSECYDIMIDLIYHNYRHYDQHTGRWCGRDGLDELVGNKNLFCYVKNSPLIMYDYLGLSYGRYYTCKVEEMCDAILSVGPFDALTAIYLASEAKSVASKVKGKNGKTLRGEHNGPQDAFRHCYWSCRMVQELGKDQAKEIGDNHERCDFGQPQDERDMDEHNNAQGRAVKQGEDCQSHCLNLLEDGSLQTKLPKRRKTQ